MQNVKSEKKLFYIFKLDQKPKYSSIITYYYTMRKKRTLMEGKIKRFKQRILISIFVMKNNF
jgi:hypothetical protein